MRADSILQDEKKCLVTGATYGLDCHHVYFGNPNRRISDEHGFWIWLRHDVHMMLHNRMKPFEKLDWELKRACQQVYEAEGHTREAFIRLIGRNYL